MPPVGVNVTYSWSEGSNESVSLRGLGPCANRFKFQLDLKDGLIRGSLPRRRGSLQLWGA